MNSEVPIALHCCSPGLKVPKDEDVCWNPSTNTTSSIDLVCKNILKIYGRFNLTDDGQLELNFGYTQQYDREQFCMANVTSLATNKTRLGAILCLGDEMPIVDDSVLGYCMLVSIVFLTITALIYALLHELRDIQGKSIINFCASLATGLGILAIMKLLESYSDMNLCAVRGFLSYFFVLAAFFWTNAMSIQILLHTRRPIVADYSWHTFKWYAIYAWGCPTVLTICIAIVNYHPYVDTNNKPGIGLMHCWFFNKKQQWYYMYSVMSLLLAVNICIFIYTSVMLWRLSLSSCHTRALRYKFVMSVRLIILMGLPWVFEMISSLCDKHIVWTIIDIFNTLQGPLIFLLLVVFRRRVVKVMYNHGWLNCISGMVEKHLAVQDDEENVVQHTDVPMNDTTIANGYK